MLFRSWLKGLKQQRLATDPAIGREALTDMIRWNHGLADSIDEVREHGRAQIADKT